MDVDELHAYQQQLTQVNQALLECPEGPQKTELLNLKSSIEELLDLTNDSLESNNTNDDKLQDEFSLFMAEMEKEGAVERKNSHVNLIDIEGKKCKAPHQHQWGDVVYHNAMICSVVSEENEKEIKVKVLYTNPTHQEMLPCPFYFESDCKFSEEQCRFSHGEIVSYSSLQEYVEPNFELLTKGSTVLAKQSNNLWYRAKIKNIYTEKCLVKFECDSKEMEISLEHILPLENDENSSDSDSDSIENEEIISREDIINNSLLITPESQAVGDWEKYTKGMGSKLMIKMGYIIGTGLGKNAEGRVDPVSAVIFPAGKSLDHCMQLREHAGGDKNLFSVEKKLKRLQKKQEIQSKRAYEREMKKRDVFTFINDTVQGKIEDKKIANQERENLKQETSRNLNIKSLQIEKDIKNTERDLDIIRNSLTRHTNVTSDVYKKLNDKYLQKQADLKNFRHQAQVVKNEQNLRDNKKKMTIF